MAEAILDDEEEEEEEEVEVPEPMDVEEEEEVEEEQQQEQVPKDKDELMGKEEFIEYVSSECRTHGNPYFLFFPSTEFLFKAHVEQGTANAIFIKMLCYFHDNRFEEVVNDEIVTLLFHLRKSAAFAVPKLSQPIEHVRKACEQFVANFTAENFIVSFMEGRAIRVYTGSGQAPYFPPFHLFDRIAKAITRDGLGVFDKNLILDKAFRNDGMPEAIRKWSTDQRFLGVQPAEQAYKQAFAEFSGLDPIN